MENIRKMVAVLRSLSLDGAPQAMSRLRELQAKATKLAELVVGCSPRDENMAPELSPTPGRYLVSTAWSAAGVAHAGRRVLYAPGQESPSRGQKAKTRPPWLRATRSSPWTSTPGYAPTTAISFCRLTASRLPWQ